jgi:hypothetical protein
MATYIKDGSTDIIGICVPRQLEPSFVSLLKIYALKFNKKLVFIGKDDLVQIIFGIMQRHNLELKDI